MGQIDHKIRAFRFTMIELETNPAQLTDLALSEYMRKNATISIDEGLSGSENMRRDELNAQSLSDEDDSRVQLRLYSWSPWCVSLGKNQKEQDIDQQRCQELGFDCVRRATGGRAVLHADELTYSVCMRIPVGVTVHDIYRVSHSILAEALREFSPEDLSYERVQPNFAQRYKGSADSVFCFSSAARSEIMWRERKVVGSAQRVFGHVLLQHGSILLGEGHLKLADVVRTDVEDDRARLARTLQEKSVSLREVCGRDISFSECSSAIQRVWS